MRKDIQSSSGTFFDLYENLLQINGMNCTDLKRRLDQISPDLVTVRALQRYRDRSRMPDYYTASKILDAFQIKYTETELNRLIHADREENDYHEHLYVRKTIRLRVRKLSDKYVEENIIKNQLYLRVEKLTGSQKKFSDYVEQLIKKDIDEH